MAAKSRRSVSRAVTSRSGRREKRLFDNICIKNRKTISRRCHNCLNTTLMAKQCRARRARTTPRKDHSTPEEEEEEEVVDMAEPRE